MSAAVMVAGRGAALHLLERAAQHPGDVAGLVLLGQGDRLSSCSSWMARENWGANFRVAEELFWIMSSLVIAIVSEKNDMASSTNTIPRAKGPACRHSSRISMP